MFKCFSKGINASIKTTVGFILSCIFACAFAENTDQNVKKTTVNNYNQSNIFIGLLYLKPHSQNLNYAYWVSGLQPYYQSWHAQTLQPNNSPALELAFNYAIPDSTYNTSIDWMHMSSTTWGSKQASTTTNSKTLELIGPPYEMSPPVFGVKKASSSVKFDFDNIQFNFGKIFNYSSRLHSKVMGGIDILHVNQTMITIFSDMAGANATPYSYALPPDPSFSNKSNSKSKYVGAGLDIDINVEYEIAQGIGLIGQGIGLLTAGTINTQQQFTGTSASLTALGIGTSRQDITTPNHTQIVPGFDGKLGLFYHYTGTKFINLTIEAGYRMLTFLNVISTIKPNTLVQPGTDAAVPEFSTGTMALVSVVKEDSFFSLSGPYVNFKVTM
jgi:hypothetical protein